MASVNRKTISATVTSSTAAINLGHVITAGDSDAYTLEITISDVTAITGTCNLHCVRGDGQTTELAATIEGNKISKVLPAALYERAGLTIWVQFLDSNLYTPLKISFSGIRVPISGPEITALDPYPAWLQAIEDADAAATTALGSAEAADQATIDTLAVKAAVEAAESLRVTAEGNRANAETTRATAETGRVTAESGRASAETARASAESSRVTAETGRATAETGRVAAETQRATDTAAAIAATNEALGDLTGLVSTHDAATGSHADIRAQLAQTVQRIDNAIHNEQNLVYSIVQNKYLVVSVTTLYAQSNASYDIVKIALNNADTVALNFIASTNFSYFVGADGKSLGKITTDYYNATTKVITNFPVGTVELWVVCANDQSPNGYVAIASDVIIYGVVTTEPYVTSGIIPIDITEWLRNNLVLKGLRKVYYVGAGQEYTNIKDAVEEAVKYENSKVYILDGTYDLYTEFGGAAFFDVYDYTVNGPGIELYNGIHLIFSSLAKVVFNYTGTNPNVLRDFSPFNEKYNSGGYTIENAKIEASNCRYCIHDEHAGDYEFYQTKIIKCNLYLDNTANATFPEYRCIGGGLGGNGTVELRDCIIESKLPESIVDGYATAYWHNHTRDGIRSTVIIEGNYFAGQYATVASTALGVSTLKTTTIIRGNSLGAAVQGDLVGTSNNVVYAYNNEVRVY